MPGKLVSTATMRSPRRATSIVTRPPRARRETSNVQSAPEPGRPYVMTWQRAARATSTASGDAAHASSKPSSGMRATNLRKVALTASSSRKMSAWSNSTDVSSAVRGR